MEGYKNQWTEKDFPVMGWHDSRVYYIQYDDEAFELILDIDYIFKWIPNGESYNFIVAPAILKFTNVWDVTSDFIPSRVLSINEISRQNPNVPLNKEYIGKDTEWDWNIDFFNGRINFKSVGFTQIIREKPSLYHSPTLSLEKRKGLMDYFNSITL
jgi:hypothetical protein